MRSVLLFPRCEGLIILGSIGTVVEGRRQNICHSEVEIGRASIKLSREIADFLSDEIERLMCAESTGAVRQDLREELSEQVVSLQDGAATVGRDVNDEFSLALGDSTVNQVGVNCLEILLLASASYERVHRQDRNIVVAFTVEEVARVCVAGTANDRCRIPWSWNRRGAGAGRTGGRGGGRSRSRRGKRQLFSGLWLLFRSEDQSVDVLTRRDVVERCQHTGEVLICYCGSVGECESGGLAGVDSSSSAATTESTCAGSTRAERHLGEGVEKVVPKSVTILETTVLTPVEQELGGVLSVNLRQRGGRERRIAEASGEDVCVRIDFRGTLTVEGDGNEWSGTTKGEDAGDRVRVVDEVSVVGGLELLCISMSSNGLDQIGAAASCGRLGRSSSSPTTYEYERDTSS